MSRTPSLGATGSLLRLSLLLLVKVASLGGLCFVGLAPPLPAGASVTVTLTPSGDTVGAWARPTPHTLPQVGTTLHDSIASPRWNECGDTAVISWHIQEQYFDSHGTPIGGPDSFDAIRGFLCVSWELTQQ